MSEIKSFFPKQFIVFVVVEIALIFSFIGVLVFISFNGGVDVFIAFAPLCFSVYGIVMSIYVGIFAGAFAESKGKTPLLWGVVGFVLTGVTIYVSILFFPPFVILAPILSTILILWLTRVIRNQQ